MLPNHLRKITIDGNDYHIKLLDGRTGLRVGMALNKIITPLLGESVDANRHDDMFHGAPKTFKQMALTLVEQLDSVDVEKIIFDDLFKYFVVNGQDAKLEVVCTGKIGLLIELIVFALKENFGELFEGKHSIMNFLAPLTQQVNLTSTE